jgi:hypothetical protein
VIAHCIRPLTLDVDEQVKSVIMLLEQGAKTHLLNMYNMAPLHLAVEMGKHEVVTVIPLFGQQNE